MERKNIFLVLLFTTLLMKPSSKAMTNDNDNDMPLEMSFPIFLNYLPTLQDIRNASLVCRAWNRNCRRILSYKKKINSANQQRIDQRTIALYYPYYDFKTPEFYCPYFLSAKTPPIFIAAAIGNIEEIKNTSDIRYKDPQNNASVLHYAAYYGQPSIVQAILEVAPDLIDMFDGCTNTPLHLAVQKRHISCVEILLRYGANPNIVDNRNETPLQKSHDDEVRALIQNYGGCDADDQNYTNAKILCNAAYNGDLQKFLSIFLNPNSKVNINGLFFYGLTPLVYAIFGGNIEIVNLILQHPMLNLNCMQIKYFSQVSFLTLAILLEKYEIAKIILRHPQINVNFFPNDLQILKGSNLITPHCLSSLMAAVYMQNIEIIQILLSLGADITAKSCAKNWCFLTGLNSYGVIDSYTKFPELKYPYTALDIAKATGNLEIINLLEEKALMR